MTTSRNFTLSLAPALFGVLSLGLLRSAHAAQQPLALSVDADTMIAFDIDSNALPAPIGTGNPANGAFGNGVEQDTPMGSLTQITLRGGDPFNPASLTAKGLIRFNLGSTGSLNIDPGLPYFLELETSVNANSNDTFRIYSINDAATRGFSESTLTWNNAPAVATASQSDFKAAGSETGVFFRPDATDGVGTRIRHPMMGSQISTFANGANSYATFGLTNTETNRWVIKSKEAGAGDAATLFTYSVVEASSSGALIAAGTWGGSTPVAANLYRINGGRNVAIDGAGSFNGEGVVVNNGTLTFAANNVNVPLIVVNAGGNLVNATGTSLSIGDPTKTEEEVEIGGGGLIVNRDWTYNAAVGQEDLSINVPLVSYHDFTFNGVAGSDLTMKYPATHRGTITFNGSGDNIVLTNDWGIGGTLVMNSTGANRILHNGDDTEQEVDQGTIVFSKPGVVDHSADDDGIGNALQGVGNLQIDAATTIDLSKTFPIAGPQTTSRRFDVTRNLRGSAPITVLGTPSNPPGQNNAFRIGAETARFTNVPEVTYSGTITTQDHAIVEARAGLPNAKVVVNANGLLTAGFMPHEGAPHLAQSTVNVGEIVLAAETAPDAGDGGQLDVGFRTGAGSRAPQNLRLTKAGGQNGNLTMAPGSSLVMQISGEPNHVFVPPDPNTTSPYSNTYPYSGPVFDTIEVEGTMVLDGELIIQLNPDVPFNEFTAGAAPPDPDYFPLHVGDTWDIIKAVGSPQPADFNGVNGVDGTDLAVWQGAYGLNDGGDADGDNDSDGGDFLLWQRQFGSASTMGSIVGTFDKVTVVDNQFDLSPTQSFEVLYTSSTLVQIRLVDSAVAAAVPEPTSFAIAATGIAVCMRVMRRPRGQGGRP